MASSSADETPLPPLPGSCLVIGGNRGLGLELVRHLKKRQSNVFATTRKTNDDLKVDQQATLGVDQTVAGHPTHRST